MPTAKRAEKDVFPQRMRELLRELLGEEGSQGRVAKRVGQSQSWVQKQLAGTRSGVQQSTLEEIKSNLGLSDEYFRRKSGSYRDFLRGAAPARLEGEELDSGTYAEFLARYPHSDRLSEWVKVRLRGANFSGGGAYDRYVKLMKTLVEVEAEEILEGGE